VTKVVIARNGERMICMNKVRLAGHCSILLLRSESEKIKFWSPMKKRKRLTWKTGAKVVKAKAADKVVELKRTGPFSHV